MDTFAVPTGFDLEMPFKDYLHVDGIVVIQHFKIFSIECGDKCHLMMVFISNQFQPIF